MGIGHHFDTNERKSHLGKIGFIVMLISGLGLYFLFTNDGTVTNESEILWITAGKWVVILGVSFIVSFLIMILGMKKWLNYRGYT